MLYFELCVVVDVYKNNFSLKNVTFLLMKGGIIVVGAALAFFGNVGASMGNVAGFSIVFPCVVC